ncbi:hypothetical protein AMECASPLE_027511 [Ameca splendens]|uniref:Uncharacterized protein n=1 Tax=Ameca splendens TaxID=208324 RepID=A0ABV0XU41_9TELE
MVCLCGCGGMVEDASPECLPLAVDLLAGEFVLFSCGFGGSVVGAVLDGVSPVAPVGGSWDSIMRGPCLAVALCGGGRTRRGCLERGCVWSLRCVGVPSSAFWG